MPRPSHLRPNTTLPALLLLLLASCGSGYIGGREPDTAENNQANNQDNNANNANNTLNNQGNNANNGDPNNQGNNANNPNNTPNNQDNNANNANNACEPASCREVGAECGNAPVGCNQTRPCGDCDEGESCGGGGPNRCGVETCIPATGCDALGVECGPASDGCDDTFDCGPCDEGFTCDEGRCVCAPLRCEDLPGACGPTDDGCGDTLDCPPCDPRAACAAFEHRCDGRTCGDDGLGGTCGPGCGPGQRCSLDGRCEACVPSCTMRRDFRTEWRELPRECGDDGCGGSCGTCAEDLTCWEGECVLGVGLPDHEARAMFFINNVRTTTEPRPASCVYEGDRLYCEDRQYLPSRLNADMIRTSRIFAHHVITWRRDTGMGFCGHDDPLDMVGAVGDRVGAFLAEQGVQNAWCGHISPEGAPIVGDPYHCCAMLIADATDWGLGQADDPVHGGGGYQSQDIGTDSAFLPVVINNEAVETAERQVNVSVWPAGVVRPMRFMRRVVEVQLSEDPCFLDAPWLPWQPTLPFELSAGEGRKVLYARARDQDGLTAVTWDSIWLGAAPPSLDSLTEGITRVRSTRLPPLHHDRFTHFSYGLGHNFEVEDIGRWNFGPIEDIDDPSASGGRARRTKLPGQPGDEAVLYTGARTGVPLGTGELWARIKAASNAPGATVANVRWREDSGGMVGGRTIDAGEFTQPDTWQWFRVPYTRLMEFSLFYIELSSGDGVLFDRVELFSAPRPLADTTGAGGLTLDFATRNWRGVELRIRYTNPDSDDFADGERINPYCALCP